MVSSAGILELILQVPGHSEVDQEVIRGSGHRWVSGAVQVWLGGADGVQPGVRDWCCGQLFTGMI